MRWVLFKSIKRLFNAGIVFMLCHARPLNRIEHIHVDFVVYLLILLGNLKCHKEDQALIVCNCGRKHARTYFPCWLLSYKNTLLIFGGSSWIELTLTPLYLQNTSNNPSVWMKITYFTKTPWSRTWEWVADEDRRGRKQHFILPCSFRDGWRANTNLH